MRGREREREKKREKKKRGRGRGRGYDEEGGEVFGVFMWQCVCYVTLSQRFEFSF